MIVPLSPNILYQVPASDGASHYYGTTGIMHKDVNQLTPDQGRYPQDIVLHPNVLYQGSSIDKQAPISTDSHYYSTLQVADSWLSSPSNPSYFISRPGVDKMGSSSGDDDAASSDKGSYIEVVLPHEDTLYVIPFTGSIKSSQLSSNL